MSTSILIIGAGGHAKVVIDAHLSHTHNDKIIVVDEKPSTNDKLLNEYPVKLFKGYKIAEDFFHIAIGSNLDRSRLANNFDLTSKKYITITHKSSIISNNSTIFNGCFIAANAIISSNVLINKGSIINHASIIDHDCQIGEFSHISPNVTLGGGVTIGTQCLIGSNAVILPGINIGNNVVIGSGSVVLEDISDNSVFCGNPAKKIN
jgi:sugar O-acyltransferase (sialic acid O-acetyltransferase NeuD family)